MPATLEQARDNPWWADPRTIGDDPDLRRLADSAVRFDHPIPFHLDVDAVYTLRGPRQVGKSTLLKRIVARLLVENTPPRCVLYFDVEGAGISAPRALRTAISAYVEWVRSSHREERVFLLLDEVTGVHDWGSAIRALYREGLLENATAIVTGSHALDLLRGGETAPGRRGEHLVEHLDWILMPLGFRDFVVAHDRSFADQPGLNIFDPEDAWRGAQELYLRAGPLRALFERYLATGGYPHAMAAEQRTGRIAPSIYELHRQAVIGQVRRAGRREPLFREIVAWAADHRLGKEFSWRDISAETEIGSKDTAREYVEDAQAMFLWHVLQRAQGPADFLPALRSPKKLYPADPFSWHLLTSWVVNADDPWAAASETLARTDTRAQLVESAVADHLMRAFRLVFYYRAAGGAEEIDFLVRRGATDTARVEVKHRVRNRASDERYLSKYGGGVLVASDELAWDKDRRVARIPVAEFLFGLREPVTLYPATAL